MFKRLLEIFQDYIQLLKLLSKVKLLQLYKYYWSVYITHTHFIFSHLDSQANKGLRVFTTLQSGFMKEGEFKFKDASTNLSHANASCFSELHEKYKEVCPQTYPVKLRQGQMLSWSPTIHTKVPSVRHSLASPGLPHHLQQLLLALHSMECPYPCAQPVPDALLLVRAHPDMVQQGWWTPPLFPKPAVACRPCPWGWRQKSKIFWIYFWKQLITELTKQKAVLDSVTSSSQGLVWDMTTGVSLCYRLQSTQIFNLTGEKSTPQWGFTF